MGRSVLLLLLLPALSLAEGRDLYEHHCIRCHREDSAKPTEFLKAKFRGKPEAIVELSERCPWGRNLSRMEIEIIAEWLSGVE